MASSYTWWGASCLLWCHRCSLYWCQITRIWCLYDSQWPLLSSLATWFSSADPMCVARERQLKAHCVILDLHYCQVLIQILPSGLLILLLKARHPWFPNLCLSSHLDYLSCRHFVMRIKEVKCWILPCFWLLHFSCSFVLLHWWSSHLTKSFNLGSIHSCLEESYFSSTV